MNIIEEKYNWGGSLSDRGSTEYIVLHHAEWVTCTAQQIHDLHKNSNGWTGIGYHFFIRKDGNVYRGRPINSLGAHVTGQNNRSLGICFEGDYQNVDRAMPESQMRSGKELIAYCKSIYSNAKIVGHREVGDSDCPGKYFPLEELKKVTTGSNSTAGDSGVATPKYTDFPKYNLSNNAIIDIATMITGEQGGEDVLACRQEASQLANLNEKRKNGVSESGILKTLHSGWYASTSWNHGYTQTAVDAVKFVLLEGKRVLPRYVTEHDMFPLDAAISGHWNNGSSENRGQYKQHQTTINQNPSRFMSPASYTFYCFFGTNQDKDVAGYYSADYEKYKSDIPWSEGASNSIGPSTASLPITTSVIKSVVGGTGAVRTNPMQDKNTLGGGVELYIVNHDNTVFYPVCSGETALTYERKDVPTKLEFTVVKTPELDFKEGSQVVFKKNGISMFYGYVFEKSRNKGSTIKVVAYDQLRYFKNKDCYVYENLNLAELLKMIANDYNLTCGNLPDTGYKIPLRVEDNVTIFDILQNAVDETLLNTGELYVIYDDFGELKVRNIKDWITDFVVDKETACDIDYKTSINDTSNRIKLYYDNGNTGEREIYINNNEEKINEWGVLQHCEKIEDGEDGVKKAEILSQLHCKKTRTLNIQNVFGNPHIRAGCMVCVILDLGDVMQQNFMLCETVKHKISNGKHVMDLSLKGGVFQD